jgi:hypothetical protein
VFHSNLKALPLPYYDMIIGIDWLEAHNPMNVDWLHKWMIIDYNGAYVQLLGVKSTLPECSLLEIVLVDQTSVVPDSQCMVQSDLPSPV